MRVFQVTTQYPSEATPDRGTFIRTQALALAKAGIDLHVIHLFHYSPQFLGSFSERWNRVAALDSETFIDESIRVTRQPYLGYPRQMYWGHPDWLMYRALRRFSLPASDLIHAHFVDPVGAAAARWCSELSRPLVVTAHGSSVHTHPMRNRRVRQRVCETATASDALLAVSQPLADQLSNLADVPVEWLPNGTDTIQFSPGNAVTARKRLGLASTTSYLLYLGRLDARKGVLDLLQAFAQLAPVHTQWELLLVGSGPALSTLQTLSGQHNLTDRVHLIGPVAHNEVVHWLRAADLFVLPSHAEGLPTTILEAGAAACPVVATNVGGISDIIKHRTTGWLIPPRRPNELQKALAICFSDSSLRVTLARHLNKKVSEHFSLATHAKRLINKYRSLIS